MKWIYCLILIIVTIPRVVLGDIVGEAAPEFTMEDVDGNVVTLTGLSDKTLMLFHFNTYCHTCRQEVPTINKIQKNYPDLRVVGIAIGNDKNEVETFRKTFKSSYTILPDPEQKLYREYFVHTVPLVDIIDKTGTIRYRGKITNYEDFESVMKKIIEEKEVVGANLWNRAPDFTLENTRGEPFKLYDIIGKKTVMVTFLSVKDKTIRQVVEIMKSLFTQYKREDLEIVRVAVHDSKEDVERFKDKYYVKFPILLDPTGDVATRYGAINLPRTFIINKKGKIRYVSDQISIANLMAILTKVKSYFKEELPQEELVKYINKAEPGITNPTKVTLEDDRHVYVGTSHNGKRKIIVREVFKDVLCDVCTNVHFVYSFDQSGAIRNIALVESIDLYGEPIDASDFLKRLIDTAREKQPIRLWKDIDGLTGATQSCKLIIEGINETSDVLVQLDKYRNTITETTAQ
jgi:peroxiredoxin